MVHDANMYLFAATSFSDFMRLGTGFTGVLASLPEDTSITTLSYTQKGIVVM